MLTKAPRGTRDILPSAAPQWQYLEEKFRTLCAQYGFHEIRTPSFEHTELFQRGVGDSTDIVRKEMYTFEDHAGRSITLKPEGTASVVRAYLEHKEYAGLNPAKYFYDTPCFRYEKPQSGRLREFHQFGLEIFGSYKMTADAEVISLAYDFLTSLGLQTVALHINSVGCPACRASYREALLAYLKPHYEELCADCKDRYVRNPMRILDCKVESCRAIVKDAPRMLDYLCEDCRTAFDDLKENLDALAIPFVVDADIVRGLDYYTKTAFEFVTDGIGAQSTICGGGRYDYLVEELGGPAVPGIGFGLGIERLLLLLEAEGIETAKPDQPDALIAVMGKAAHARGLALARDLRRKGLACFMDDNERNFKGQLKYADRLGARYAILIGDNELQKNEASVRDMASSSQTSVAFDKLFDFICGR